MTERECFLQSIMTEPGEDTHRLVFADWLTENGEAAYGEFIRVQCEIDRIEASGTADPKQYADPARGHYPTPPDLERLMALRRRERELLLARVGGWTGYARWTHRFGLPKLDGGNPPPVTAQTTTADVIASLPYQFRRGFVARVTLTAADWLAHADALYWHPEQTVACGTCRGSCHFRWVGADGRTEEDECGICCDQPTKGRVPRPFVPTAHPITKVALADLHSVYSESDNYGGYGRFRSMATRHGFDWRPGDEPDRWLRVFRAEWPHIEFTPS